MSDDTTPAHRTIAEALAAFQSEMPTVAKSKMMQVRDDRGGTRAYAYADLADVTAAAVPVLVRHGLSFTATPKRVDGTNEYELVGTLRHTSGGRVRGGLPLRGRTAQEVGSAITYARRYLLGCLTGIVTESDDDGAAASGVVMVPAGDDAAEGAVDAETAVYDAIAGTDDPAELALIYDTHRLRDAPAHVREKFAERVAEVSRGAA